VNISQKEETSETVKVLDETVSDDKIKTTVTYSVQQIPMSDTQN